MPFYVCENVVRGLGKFDMSLQLIKTKSLPRHWSRSQDTILTKLAHHQDTYLLPSQSVVCTWVMRHIVPFVRQFHSYQVVPWK